MIKPHKCTHGFTLIEVLVSVLIFSIGLLGLAGLQITALRTVNNATLDTQATLALNDIIERMRANPVAVDADAFANPAIVCTTMPAPYCSQYNDQVAALSCTPAQMATYDLNVWFCGEQIAGGARTPPLSALFPQATFTIVCDDEVDNIVGEDGDPCTNGSQHTLTLAWQEQNPDKMDIRDAAGALTLDGDGDGAPDGDGVPDDFILKNITMTITP